MTPRPSLIHDVYVLLNRTHEFWVWNGVNCGVDEVLQFILSRFEVIKRVLETSDFLNDQFTTDLVSVASCVPWEIVPTSRSMTWAHVNGCGYLNFTSVAIFAS